MCLGYIGDENKIIFYFLVFIINFKEEKCKNGF